MTLLHIRIKKKTGCFVVVLLLLTASVLLAKARTANVKYYLYKVRERMTKKEEGMEKEMQQPLFLNMQAAEYS